jgi:hypothetical protein
MLLILYNAWAARYDTPEGRTLNIEAESRIYLILG